MVGLIGFGSSKPQPEKPPNSPKIRDKRYLKRVKIIRAAPVEDPFPQRFLVFCSFFSKSLKID